MSKIAIKGNESGTATFTIEAPATNTDRIFELPDEAGKVLTDASDIEPQVKTATNASGSAPIYACRAWVNFNGTGTVAIRASGNVSSITDNGTGDYTVNFATEMPDTNYIPVSNPAKPSLAGVARVLVYREGTKTTSAIQFQCEATDTGTDFDISDCYIAFFR